MGPTSWHVGLTLNRGTWKQGGAVEEEDSIIFRSCAIFVQQIMTNLRYCSLCSLQTLLLITFFLHSSITPSPVGDLKHFFFK